MPTRTRRTQAASTGTRRAVLRCAIYTRKSSDEGLDQSFNSLDAQREACSAYIASQKHEGWTALPAAYDDGGFSGGSMERPALKRLLADAENGAIDVVVVYKVDRLTRSLSDFARLTDLFDRNSVSFVSVTQQFNTSTSMGRLTLNVLLSFAQFERELAGERIRDKIALSKRRGMWMGGLPPLGYDGVDKKLIVNEAEAETVRFIFRKYLEVGSITGLKRALHAAGVVSKRRAFSDGRTAGGALLSRGAIYQILRNRLYRGEIAYRGEVHSGQHQPIVDETLWTKVQERLADQAQRPRGARGGDGSEPALLAGLVFDGDGNRLTPTHTSKRGRRYRYYVSAPLVRGGRSDSSIRVSAPELERAVAAAIGRHLQNATWVAKEFAAAPDAAMTQKIIVAAAKLARELSGNEDRRRTATAKVPRSFLLRVGVTRSQITISLDRSSLRDAVGAAPQPGTADNALAPLEIVAAAEELRRASNARLVVGDVLTQANNVDKRLVRLVVDAYRWFDELRTGRVLTVAEIARREGRQVSDISRTLPLAFLPPGIVEMVVDGRHPPFLDARKLACRTETIPIWWTAQLALLNAHRSPID